MVGFEIREKRDPRGAFFISGCNFLGNNTDYVQRRITSCASAERTLKSASCVLRHFLDRREPNDQSDGLLCRRPTFSVASASSHLLSSLAAVLVKPSTPALEAA